MSKRNVRPESSMRFKSLNAFSLIELLVVITIIAILSSVMMVLVGQIRSLAQHQVCQKRLAGYFAAFTAHETENEAIPYTSVEIGDIYVPVHWRYLHTTGNLAGEFSVEDMLQYLDSGGASIPASTPVGTFVFPRSWACPSWDKRRLASMLTAFNFDGVPSIGSPGYMLLTGKSRSSQVTGNVDISDKKMDARKLVMACSAWNWSNIEYNVSHTVAGSEFAIAGKARPTIAGQNQLFGDGHVEWRDLRSYSSAIYNFQNAPKMLSCASTKFYY